MNVLQTEVVVESTRNALPWYKQNENRSVLLIHNLPTCFRTSFLTYGGEFVVMAYTFGLQRKRKTKL